MNHSVQPTYIDEHGTQRFKPNAIVNWLLDEGPFDLNDIAMHEFSQEDYQQIAQLIGYTISGYSDLSYVDAQAAAAAEMSGKGMSDQTAIRIASLEAEVAGPYLAYVQSAYDVRG